MGKILLSQWFQRVKILPQGELIVITHKAILLMSRTDLVKYLQMPVHASNIENPPFKTPKVIPEFVESFELFFSCSALHLRTPRSIQLIRPKWFTELIASINTKTIDTIDLINWHCRPHQPDCITVVSFLYLPDWLR